MTMSEDPSILLAELGSVAHLDPFSRFERVWNVLVRAGLAEEGKSEGVRANAVLERVRGEALRAILASTALETLLTLQPPLESVLVNEHEQLRSLEAERARLSIQRVRLSNPEEALRNVATLLLLIRNKRMHGFKSPGRPRDLDILEPACQLLSGIAQAALVSAAGAGGALAEGTGA